MKNNYLVNDGRKAKLNMFNHPVNPMSPTSQAVSPRDQAQSPLPMTPTSR